MLHSTHRPLLVAFLGAVALFASTVTPALFAVAPPSVAARVVGRVLPVLDAVGLALGLAAGALGATGRSGRAAGVRGGAAWGGRGWGGGPGEGRGGRPWSSGAWGPRPRRGASSS